tara:strand:+ start:937 stop:1179 length:243 start_codon:yes stop_codon:yes gene_type:complete
MRVAKWGNSLAIRLPAELVEVLDLKEGDNLEVLDANDSAITVKSSPKFLELVERLQKEGKLFPSNYKFKRSDAYEGSGRY